MSSKLCNVLQTHLCSPPVFVLALAPAYAAAVYYGSASGENNLTTQWDSFRLDFFPTSPKNE